MNTHIYIIRHAEADYPLDSKGRKIMYRPETPINDEGKEQTIQVAQQLKDRGVCFDRIETGPFSRSVETAQIFAEIMGTQEIIENPAFSESYVPGWFDVPIIEFQKLTDKGEDIYLNSRSDDQEEYEKIAERMLAGFKDLVERNKGRIVAIISHGDPIRLLLYRLERPQGEIPNMSILSKQSYLKRSEAFHIVLDENGKIRESELITIREGLPGKKEILED